MEEGLIGLIELNKRFKAHGEKSNELKLAVESLNLRKGFMSEKIEELESRGFDFPDVFSHQMEQLITVAEHRKSLYEDWNEVNGESDELFRKEDNFEYIKSTSTDRKLSGIDKSQIEDMLSQWDIILRRQESLIIEREKAINEERRIISQMEKTLNL